MSGKAVIVREGSYKRTIVVVLPDGLSATDLVAALNSEEAKQVGDFFISPDTFSARIENNNAEFPDNNWLLVSTDEAPSEHDLAHVVEELKAGAKRDALAAAAEETAFSFKHRIGSLNQLAFELLQKGDVRASRKLVSAASVLYSLAGGGDSDEALWLLNLKSFNCSASGQHKAAWRYGRKAIDMARRVYGADSASYGVTLNNIAEGQLDAGNYARAEKLFDEGIGLLDKAIEGKAVDLVWAENARADAASHHQRLLELTGRGQQS